MLYRNPCCASWPIPCVKICTCALFSGLRNHVGRITRLSILRKRFNPPIETGTGLYLSKTKESYFSTELMELDAAWQSLAHMLEHRPHPMKIKLHQTSIQTAFSKLTKQFEGIDLSSWQAKINAKQDSI